MIINIITISELYILINNSKSLVIDFYADWCGPCKKLGLILEKIMNQEEFRDIVFCKLDINNSEFKEICTQYKVNGIPHVEFFKNSKNISTLIGLNENKLLENIRAIL